MKKLLNTLYVTTQGAYLALDNEAVSVRVEKEERLRVPLINLEGIVGFGQVSCSPPLMGDCMRRGIAITHLDANGRFLARVTGETHGNVLLRREQYRKADRESEALQIAAPCVAAKIANARNALMRAQRDMELDAGAAGEVAEAAAYLARLDALGAGSLASLRGVEGDAARTYFGVFDHLIVVRKEDFRFAGRSRRPPLDRVNCVLSFLYTLLAHDCAGALEAAGLDSYVGYLHADRSGRAGLALDLMEEFRVYLADRLALTLINRQQVKPGGFTTAVSGAVTMSDDTRKEVIGAYQKRKAEEVVHPVLQEKMSLGLLPLAQARLLARAIRGELEFYPAFLWR